MKKKLFYIAMIVFPGVILLNSCAKNYSSSPYPMPAGTTASSAMVSIKNFAFAPDTIIIKTGTAVTWSNMDNTPHTVTSLTGLFDSGSMAAGQMYSYTFPTAGTYVYHCTIHPAEKAGVVIVGN